MSGRGIFVNQNGTWKTVSIPSIRTDQQIPTNLSLTFAVAGGGGGGGGSDSQPGHAGYSGHLLRGAISINSSYSIQVYVGTGGSPGSSGGGAPGGSGGTNSLGYNGGRGSNAGPVPWSGAGGGGGAATVIRANGSNIIVAAGGGGGGGGGNYSSGQGQAGYQSSGGPGGSNGQDKGGDGGGAGGGGGGEFGGAGGAVNGGDSGGNSGSDGADSSTFSSYVSAGNGGSTGGSGGNGYATVTYTSPVNAPLYTGGTVTVNGRVYTHTFNSNGTLVATGNQSPWSTVKAGWVNQGGQWKQFYPPNVTADIIVIGGGGGGGVGYGWEGGGGGGAGGVVFGEQLLTSSEVYYVTIGAGGSPNSSGQDSYFGTTDKPSVTPGVSSPVYAGTYPVYPAFLNTYGVWYDTSFNSGGGSVNYYVNILAAGQYTVACSADNAIQVSINGTSVASNANWGTTDYGTIRLSPGLATITCASQNWGGPALFAASLTDFYGNQIWNTRQTSPIITGNPLLAIGGGNGGWGTPSNTAGTGGSGGGGCGYAGDRPGNSGTANQGNSGATGYWQNVGGGGGGWGGPGSPTGTGGAGYRITKGGVTIEIGGGGGGGWGTSGPGGTGPGGAAAGGGGVGNGGNGVNGTGGGGGGSMHSAYTNAGNGGSGAVYVQYAATSAFFTGGEIQITSDNGVSYVTHKFITPGSWTLKA